MPSVLDRMAKELVGGLPERMAGPAASLAHSVRHRQRCRVRRENELWVHSYSAGVVVQPTIGARTPDAWDLHTRDLFLHFYTPRPGDIVYDVGAGIGGEVGLFSRLVGPSGRVVSIEAHPRVFGCLEQSVRRNQLTNVTTRHCALVEHPGTVLLEDVTDYDLRSHLENRLTTSAGGVPVPGERLEDVMTATGTPTIDLLKLNIEGAELPVLRGARDVLPRVRRVIVHCHDFVADRTGDQWFRTFAPVRDLLVDAGYELHLRPDDPRPWVRDSIHAVQPGLEETLP